MEKQIRRCTIRKGILFACEQYLNHKLYGVHSTGEKYSLILVKYPGLKNQPDIQHFLQIILCSYSTIDFAASSKGATVI